MRKTVLSCCLIAIAAFSAAQQKTLSQFVSERVDSPSGGAALVYLEGDRIKSDGASLDDFDRKLVTIGSLKAIVPKSMVRIDDSFNQPPNLYDGLDLKTKVLYLLSTLSEKQMKTAASKGIGIGDLSAEQQNVFRSILPKKFHIDKMEPEGKQYRVADSFYLTESQREQVRLKFTKSVEIDLMMAGRNAYTMVDSMDYLGTQFLSELVRRQDEKNTGPDEAYGVKFRSLVPNESKPTDLDYSSPMLKKAIGFKAPTTIVDVLKKIRSATSVSVIPDPRVASRLVSFVGHDVQIGDLLKSIAQMVTGTYRRVGPDYVLTSDLMGLGTRKLRFYEWEEDIRTKIWADESEWRSKIGKTNALDLVQTNPNDPIQPSGAFKDYLAKSDVGTGLGRIPIPDDAIDGTLREFVNRRNEQYPKEPVTEKGMVARSSLQFNFVLANGQDLKEGNYDNRIGTFDTYRTRYGKPVEDTTVLYKRVEPGSNLGLAVRASDAATAEKLLDKAGSIGFKEVWLETDDESVLKAAIAKGKSLGIAIRLAIRPWGVKTSDDLPDLNLLGQTGDSLESWIRGNNRTKPGSEPTGAYRAIPLPENAIPPAQEPRNWVSVAKLSATAGLVGVIVLDPQTQGYEPILGESQSTSSALLIPRYFGYSLQMRREFLNQTGVDPIDLVPPKCYSSVNVNPFFFTDYELMGSPREIRTGTDEALIVPYVARWQAFRASKMQEGLKRLSAQVLSKANVPIWSDLLLNSSNRPMADLVPIIDYRASNGFEYDTGEAGTPFGAMYATPQAMRYIVDPVMPETANMELVMKLLSQPDLRKQKFVISYDISKLKFDEASKFLDKWFVAQK